uniref:RalBP1-associated Eps domain-containing protein 2 n=1 Tax=Echinostoma caproni TaxID=27848 RepID=A0A183AX49_9TREM
LSEMSAEFPAAGFELNESPRLDRRQNPYSGMPKTHRVPPAPNTNSLTPANWTRFSDDDQPNPEEEEDRGLLTNERVNRPDELSFYESSALHRPISSSTYKDPFSISPNTRSSVPHTSPGLFTSSPSGSPSVKTTPSPVLHSHPSPPPTPFRQLVDPGEHSPDRHHWAYRPLEDGYSSNIYAPPTSDLSSTQPGSEDQSRPRNAPHIHIPLDRMTGIKHIDRAKSTEDSLSPSSIVSPSDGVRDLSSSEPGSPRAVDRRWLSLFTLHPKEEAQYADQFDQVVDAQQHGDLRRLTVTQAESRKVFLTQFNVTPSSFDKIWRLADMDRDNRLSKPEFCLAAHLAHLHGRQGLSLEQAVSATASYIADHLPWDLRHSLRTGSGDRRDHHHHHHHQHHRRDRAYLNRPEHHNVDSSNRYQPIPCSPPSDVASNNLVCCHSPTDLPVSGRTIANHKTYSPISPFVDPLDTCNPDHNHLPSHRLDHMTLVDGFHGRDPDPLPVRTVREHGEEVSDEDLGLEDGEAEPETALLPSVVSRKKKLRLVKSRSSSSSSSALTPPSRADSDADERDTRVHPASSSSTASFSSAASCTSSSDEEHVLSSAPTTVTTSTTTSTSSSLSSSSSGASNTDNENSGRKRTTFNPDYLFPNGKLSVRKCSKHRYVDTVQSMICLGCHGL